MSFYLRRNKDCLIDRQGVQGGWFDEAEQAAVR